MDDEPHREEIGAESRQPTVEDLVVLCRELNSLGARYIVIGGFAIRGAGYLRQTYDVDLIIDTKVYKALEILPDKAVQELKPGEVSQYAVVRVADEITVNLMASACGTSYEEAARDQIVRMVEGVPIPFASPRMLWRMKEKTHREKDAGDLLFLRQNYADQIFGQP